MVLNDLCTRYRDTTRHRGVRAILTHIDNDLIHIRSSIRKLLRNNRANMSCTSLNPSTVKRSIRLPACGSCCRLWCLGAYRLDPLT
jgi:hypothetical protein